MGRAGRFTLLALEIALFSTLVCATRCANWRDVFAGDAIYFTDADCYSRMTRARACFERPGTIIRHHQFENFPAGTTPHTTAPFDYAIVALAECVRPFAQNALEIAGAFISPLLALIGGWFLCWWMRRMRFRWRFAGLLLYAMSPIIVHATELGRPDHQSLILVLVLVAVCAEWSLRTEASRTWSAAAGATWALAIWVSAYEPLVLLLIAALFSVRTNYLATRWLVFASITVIALLIERRIFVVPGLSHDPLVANWLSTIGEMQRVPLLDSTWIRWCGLFVIAAPVLVVLHRRARTNPPLLILLLTAASFAATLLQARWGYFFAGLLALLLPSLLSIFPAKPLAVASVVMSFAPIVHPSSPPNDSLRAERMIEMRDIRAAAEAMITRESTGFVAPWWLSPAIAYWSGSNGVAGSSHESIEGIAATARFYLSADLDVAQRVLHEHHVTWVIAYDPDRVTQNSAAVLGVAAPPHNLAVTLARTPSRAPRFLIPVYQNGTCTLFSLQNSP